MEDKVLHAIYVSKILKHNVDNSQLCVKVVNNHVSIGASCDFLEI